ncbi:MAG: hypothetical protein AB8B84_03170 [Granulosicoccus sp.]
MTNPASNNTYGPVRATYPHWGLQLTRWLTACLCASLFSVFATGLSYAAGLSVEQQNMAGLLAAAVPWPTGRALTDNHPLASQTLSIEKQERKNQRDVRFINVYQYNYSQRAARLVVIDLQDETLLKTSSIASVHLPLNDIEIEYAMSLLVNSTSLLESLKREHLKRSAQPFSSIDELDVKASIYEPRDTNHACQYDRCALLSLFDNTNTVFTIEPVINLSTLTVSVLNRR